MSRTFFISGHPDITAEEFRKHYEHRIRKYNAEYIDSKFIVCDESEFDRMAQDFLRRIGVPPKSITIYHMSRRAPINRHQYNTKAFARACARNHAATMASTHDILWIRDNDSVCGNLARRRMKDLPHDVMVS